MSRYERLTDAQWAFLSALILPSLVHTDGRSRSEVLDDQAVMDGVLWVLRTGASWADLPDRFSLPSTCFRRFSRWVKAGVLREISEALARDLEERGGIVLTEYFIDGTFTVAKKRAPKSERPSGKKVGSSWLLQTLLVFHSPCTRLLLRHMKSPLSSQRSLKPSSWDDSDELRGIVPTVVVRSISSRQPTESN